MDEDMMVAFSVFVLVPLSIIGWFVSLKEFVILCSMPIIILVLVKIIGVIEKLHIKEEKI